MMNPFDSFVDEVVGTPFVIGETSCIMLLARAIDVQHGTQYWQQYKHLDTENYLPEDMQGERIIYDIVRAECKETIDRKDARAGDVFVGWRAENEMCGVVVNDRQCMTSNPEVGVCLFPLQPILRLYKAEVFRWV